MQGIEIVPTAWLKPFAGKLKRCPWQRDKVRDKGSGQIQREKTLDHRLVRSNEDGKVVADSAEWVGRSLYWLNLRDAKFSVPSRFAIVPHPVNEQTSKVNKPAMAIDNSDRFMPRPM